MMPGRNSRCAQKFANRICTVQALLQSTDTKLNKLRLVGVDIRGVPESQLGLLQFQRPRSCALVLWPWFILGSLDFLTESSPRNMWLSVWLRKTCLLRSSDIGSNSQSNTASEKNVHAHVDKVSIREVDSAAQLVAGTRTTFHADEARRIRCVQLTFKLQAMQLMSRYIFRRKIDRHIMPLMCSKPELLSLSYL